MWHHYTCELTSVSSRNVKDVSVRAACQWNGRTCFKSFWASYSCHLTSSWNVIHMYKNLWVGQLKFSLTSENCLYYNKDKVNFVSTVSELNLQPKWKSTGHMYHFVSRFGQIHLHVHGVRRRVHHLLFLLFVQTVGHSLDGFRPFRPTEENTGATSVYIH